MTDLEKLKAVFDEIGMTYTQIEDKDSLSLECHPIVAYGYSGLVDFTLDGKYKP